VVPADAAVAVVYCYVSLLEGDGRISYIYISDLLYYECMLSMSPCYVVLQFTHLAPLLTGSEDDILYRGKDNGAQREGPY
jgi:hypothetical protein